MTLLSESSVAAGTRRVEGLVGLDAFRYLARERLLLEPGRRPRSRRRGPKRSRSGSTTSSPGCATPSGSWRSCAPTRSSPAPARSPSRRRDVGGVALVAAQAPDGTGAKDVRTLALDVRGRLGDRPAVVVVAASTDGKVPLVVADHRGGPRARTVCPARLFDAVTPAIIGGGGGGATISRRAPVPTLAPCRGRSRPSKPPSRGQPVRAGECGRADRSRRGQRAGGRCGQRPGCPDGLSGDGGPAPPRRQRPRRAGRDLISRAGRCRGRGRAAADARRAGRDPQSKPRAVTRARCPNASRRSRSRSSTSV